MKFRRAITIIIILIGIMIFTTEATASEAIIPSGIKESEIGGAIEITSKKTKKLLQLYRLLYFVEMKQYIRQHMAMLTLKTG